MAAAQQVVDHELLAMTECAAQGLIQDLGFERRRGALQSVEGFQIIWNSLLPDVRGVPGISIPSQNNGQLVVDGLYGPQSASAVNNFVKTAVPVRAADMPAWFAQNQGSVAAMCTPAPPVNPVPPMPQGPPVVAVPDQLALEPPPQVIPAPVPPAPAPPPPQAYVPPADTGPVIEAQYPQAQGPVEVLPDIGGDPLALEPELIKQQMSQGPVLVESPEPPALAPELPAVRVMAQPTTGNVPVLAAAVGLLAVGGVAAYWLFGRKRKR